jgi:hypothetical protein
MSSCGTEAKRARASIYVWVSDLRAAIEGTPTQWETPVLISKSCRLVAC